MLTHRAAGSFRSSRKAFTLTEMAIVLGILGLIISVIYAAAGGTRNSIRAGEVTSQLSVIVDNVRSYYASQSIPTAPPTCANAFANSADILLMIKRGFYPPDVVDLAAVGTEKVRAAICKDGTDPVQVVVRYTNIPQRYCQSIVLATSSPALGMRLSKTVVGATEFNKLTSAATDVDPKSGAILPTSTSLTTACSPDETTLYWYYNLGS